jgi:hypothetical protein
MACPDFPTQFGSREQDKMLVLVHYQVQEADLRRMTARPSRCAEVNQAN